MMIEMNNMIKSGEQIIQHEFYNLSISPGNLQIYIFVITMFEDQIHPILNMKMK